MKLNSDCNLNLKHSIKMKAVQIKWKYAAPAAFVATVFLYYFFSTATEMFDRWTDVLRRSDCKASYLLHPTVKKALRYCNTITREPTGGLEGTGDKDLFELELVQVVIRHGDRAPIHSIPNYQLPHIPCIAHPDLLEVAPFYEEFTTRLSKPAVKRTQGQSFFNWDLFPNRESCTPSLLTPEGAVQHIKLGQHMRDAYLEKGKLLPSESAWDQIKMISTTKSRTYQSGIAFMYGFLSNLNPQRLNIEAAMDVKMCTKNTKFPCGCPAINRYMDVMSTSFKQTYPEFIDNKLVRSAYEDMATAMQVDPKELPRGTHVYDIHMVHACHGLTLPGIGDTCTTPRALVDIASAMNNNGMANQKSPIWQRITRLKMMPLLHEIYKRMEGLAENRTREKFVLYSGHDTTIEPLITTLGITDGTWPPYASRLVFETYSFNHNGHKHYLLRVLFNGEDVTARLIFCRPEGNEVKLNDDGMCSQEDFEDFIESSSMKDLKTTKNYRELCAETII